MLEQGLWIILRNWIMISGERLMSSFSNVFVWCFALSSSIEISSAGVSRTGQRTPKHSELQVTGKKMNV